MPDVSLVIPTHNRAAKVERAIGSVVEPGLDLEIIVVDDASTDTTRQNLEARGGIRYFHLNRNGGPAVARNEGIRRANAPLIAFLDSDDQRLPGSLARQVARLGHHPECALVYGRYRYDTAVPPGLEAQAEFLGALPEGDVYEQLFSTGMLPSTVVVRAETLNELGGFDPDPAFVSCEDWDLWLRICARHRVCLEPTEVAIREFPGDDSHLWGDPVRVALASARVVRRHLRGPYARPMDRGQRSLIERKVLRRRTDIMLWNVLYPGRPSSNRLRLRSVLACLTISPGYMLHSANLKNLIKLLLQAGGESAPAFWRAD